jgi:ABC-type transporter Mla MlaB component
MSQKDITEVWRQRQSQNSKKATAYNLNKVWEFEQEALNLIKQLRHEQTKKKV